MVHRKEIILSLLFLTTSYPCYAARPLATEDAEVSPGGAFSMEAGMEYTISRAGDKTTSFIPAFIYGITKWLEFTAEFPYVFINPREGERIEGLQDVNVIFKINMLNQYKRGLFFTLRSQIKLSNGDEKKDLGSGDEDIGFIGVLTKRFKKLTFHLNLGYIFVGKEKDKSLKNSLIYGLAIESSFSDTFIGVFEIYGETDSHFDIKSFEHHLLTPLIGIRLQSSKKVTFDSALRIGIFRKEVSEFGIVIGTTIEF